MQIKIVKLNPDAVLPSYATYGSAGADLFSINDYTIASGERLLVSTGIAVEIPEGYEGQVRPRSGLAIKNGITVLNSPGTIDSDYRGEIKVILINLGKEDFSITKGAKIAQLVFAKVESAKFISTTNLSDTDRGEKGFGSTGI